MSAAISRRCLADERRSTTEYFRISRRATRPISSCNARPTLAFRVTSPKNNANRTTRCTSGDAKANLHRLERNRSSVVRFDPAQPTTLRRFHKYQRLKHPETTHIAVLGDCTAIVSRRNLPFSGMFTGKILLRCIKFTRKNPQTARHPRPQEDQDTIDASQRTPDSPGCSSSTITLRTGAVLTGSYRNYLLQHDFEQYIEFQRRRN